MPERWVSDESQSYYLDSEGDPGSCDPMIWATEANLSSIDNPIPFRGQYETIDQGTTSFSDPVLDIFDYPGAHGGYPATDDLFTDTNTFSPISNQCLDVGQTYQETRSEYDFGAYNPLVWEGEANLASSESVPVGEPYRATDQGHASCSSGVLDTVDYPGVSVTEDLSTSINTLSSPPIRGFDLELARQDTCSTSLTEVVHDILSNSFACALDRPANALRHDRGRGKELVEPASGQKRRRKKSGAEDQQMMRNPVNAFATLPRPDKTFTGPLLGLKVVTGYNTSFPKSRFDMYIAALRQVVQSASETRFLEMRTDLRRAATAEGVLWAVREAWPAAEGYWNLTATFRGFLYAEIWRNFPSESTYRQLPPAYRPTRAQLMIPHSAMIDWLPWPDVRDMAIKFQDSIDMDALFRMAIHNVVAHRKRPGRERSSSMKAFDPNLSAGPELNENTSFRVWDLVRLEKYTGVNPLAEPGLKKRPVVRSPNLRALLQAYELEYDEFETQRLDDEFFEAYPYLYCDSAASRWKVKDLSNLPGEDVGTPVDLTSAAVLRLQSRLQSLTGAQIDIQ